MRIAQIAPIIERVPPKKYGGSERVVYELTEELVKRGHDVTLFASGDSKTSAKLISVYPTSLREAKLGSVANGKSAWTMLNLGLAYDQQDQFDIIHDHTHVIGLPTANIATTPVVITLHDPIFANYKQILETLTNPYIVTISKSQGEPAPKMNNIATVYNGLSMDSYVFSKTHDGYLLYFGTFRPEKGADKAIEVAKKLNLPLILAGKLDNWQKPFFSKYIKPYLSKKIQYIGEIGEVERNKLMSKAMCLLHPISWREPFGLNIIEAMACGAPVVAFNRGSIPELIENGKTGYVVENTEEMIAAILNIDTINREECRKHALKNFNAKRMTDEYEKVYEKILEKKIKRTINIITKNSMPIFSKSFYSTNLPLEE